MASQKILNQITILENEGNLLNIMSGCHNWYFLISSTFKVWTNSWPWRNTQDELAGGELDILHTLHTVHKLYTPYTQYTHYTLHTTHYTQDSLIFLQLMQYLMDFTQWIIK